jgi:hypothetical protein
VLQAQVDAAQSPGVTTVEQQRIKQLDLTFVSFLQHASNSPRRHVLSWTDFRQSLFDSLVT